jgi:hypothetical protein
MVDKLIVVRWLLGHVKVLKEIAGIVAGWSDAAALSAKLEIIHKVAQALLPVIESFPLFRAQAVPVTAEEADEDLRTVEALAIPIPVLVNVIAPIVVALIRLLLAKRDDA